jgi:N-acyl homoserine lactone hydrolase
MSLAQLPQIDRLTLARVTRVPQEHPEFDVFEPFPVHGWVIRHAGGAVLFDTGIGLGSPEITEWYQPEVIPLEVALHSVQLTSSDITAVVLSHLHFDHCGQQGALTAPVFLQAAERDSARSPGYTIPEWADIAGDRLRLVKGDDEILPGISVMATPGHTPGHQSLLVQGGGQRVILAGQCAFRADEVRSGIPGAANLHDPSWYDEAAQSLARVRALHPLSVELSHDTERVRLD